MCIVSQKFKVSKKKIVNKTKNNNKINKSKKNLF